MSKCVIHYIHKSISILLIANSRSAFLWHFFLLKTIIENLQTFKVSAVLLRHVLYKLKSETEFTPKLDLTVQKILYQISQRERELKCRFIKINKIIF